MQLQTRAIAAGMAMLSSLGLMGGVALAATANISQRNLAFSQAVLEVVHGTVVTFTNDDTVSHNILVSGNGVNLNSGLQAPGTPFRAPFLKPGTYAVMCGIHPKMKMTVKVN